MAVAPLIPAGVTLTAMVMVMMARVGVAAGGGLMAHGRGEQVARGVDAAAAAGSACHEGWEGRGRGAGVGADGDVDVGVAWSGAVSRYIVSQTASCCCFSFSSIHALNEDYV